MCVCVVSFLTACALVPLGFAQGDFSKSRDGQYAGLVHPCTLVAGVASSVKPAFPSPPEKHTGFCAVEVLVDARGEPELMKPVDCPDSRMADSVLAALRKWRFSPFMHGQVAIPVHGKLFFYFDVTQGTPRVKSACGLDLDATKEVSRAKK